MKKKIGIVAITVIVTVALMVGACGTTIAFLSAMTGKDKSVENTFVAKELEAVNLTRGRYVGQALRGKEFKDGEPDSDSSVKKVIIGCLSDYSSVITDQMKAKKIHVGLTAEDKVYVYNGGGETAYILSDDNVLINANVDCGRFFQNMHSLETIEFGKNFRLPTDGSDYEGGASIFYMFGNCEKLTTIKGINATTFNTSNVTWFQNLFDNCESLPTEQIQNIVDVLVTDKATQMFKMFENCQKLTEIDLTGLKTPNNYDLQYIFNGCTNLEKIKVKFGEGNFDTSKVIRFTGMFRDCIKLDNSDFNELLVDSGLDTSSAQVMSSMFDGCTGVTELDVSCFKTSKVGTGEASNGFCSMFSGCTKLEKIIGLTNFDVSKAYGFGGMFKDCSSITELDLSSFDLTGLGSATRRPSDNKKYPEIINSMFNGCSNLKTIYATDKFVVSDVINLNDGTHSYDQHIFTGCDNLVGGKGTAYDGSHVDGEYAHIDGGAGNPGYLTVKN